MNTLCLHGAEGRRGEEEEEWGGASKEEEEVQKMEEGYGVRAANN